MFCSVSTDVMCLQSYCKKPLNLGQLVQKNAGNSFVCNSHMKENAQFARLLELM